MRTALAPRRTAVFISAVLLFAPLRAAELDKAIPPVVEAPLESVQAPALPAPASVPGGSPSQTIPSLPSAQLSLTLAAQPDPKTASATAGLAHVATVVSKTEASPQADPARVSTTLTAAYDNVQVSQGGDAAPVVAPQCPFHRLLGLKTGGPAPERRPEPRKPASPWVLKFSPWRALVDSLRHLWDVLRGRDSFKGNPRPPRAHLMPLLEIGLEHLTNPVRGLEAVHARYGDASYYEAPTGHRVFFVSDPKAVNRILNSTDRLTLKSDFEKSEIAVGGIAKLTGRHTIFLGMADRWRARRKLMQPFLIPKVVHTEGMADEVRGVVDAGLDELAFRAGVSPTGALDTRVSDEMSVLTMQVILKTLFGADATRVELLHSIGPAFAEITRTVPIESLNPFTARLSDAPLIYPRRRQLRSAYRTLDLFAERILERGRRRKEHKADLLDALLQAKGEDGKPLSDAEIKNEILTMILAGHETTSATATWALYSLSRRPDALARLRAEIDDGPETPGYADLNKGYGFLDQVLQETLRLYTPAYALFRKAVDDAEVPLEDGSTMFVPKGSHVVLSTFVTHRRPRQWEATGFDAAGFFPERFDEENLAARGLKRADLVSFPFGMGPRMCLGQALSLLEARLIVIRFLQRFELEPLSTRPAKIVSDIGVKLDDGFPALIRPRR